MGNVQGVDAFKHGGGDFAGASDVGVWQQRGKLFAADASHHVLAAFHTLHQG